MGSIIIMQFQREYYLSEEWKALAKLHRSASYNERLRKMEMCLLRYLNSFTILVFFRICVLYVATKAINLQINKVLIQ